MNRSSCVLKKSCHKSPTCHNQVSLNSLPLRLLAQPATRSLLDELAVEPRELKDLRQVLGSPPETTVRGYVRPLVVAGAIEQRRHGGFPGGYDYRLTPAGRDLAAVGQRVAAWLDAAPRETAPLGSEAGKRAIRALVNAWEAGIVRALTASRPTVTQLAIAIPEISYPALERRVTAMRRIGMVDTSDGGREGFPLLASDWLRASAVPLTAAVRWELEWQGCSVLGTVREIEAALLA